MGELVGSLRDRGRHLTLRVWVSASPAQGHRAGDVMTRVVAIRLSVEEPVQALTQVRELVESLARVAELAAVKEPVRCR